MKPLAVCKLRTAGLASVNSAKFGMVRHSADGTPRAHQGIDLIAEPNTEVLAVANGTIVAIAQGLNGYGYTLTLKVSNLFAFYAHLSKFKVSVGDEVRKGDVIAYSGHTGNAEGMNDVKHGSHLHFEIRAEQNCGLGLTGRLDPLKYVELD